jgi:hypothetical protein
LAVQVVQVVALEQITLYLVAHQWLGKVILAEIILHL